MKFCPECSSMMLPKDGIWVCRNCENQVPNNDLDDPSLLDAVVEIRSVAREIDKPRSREWFLSATGLPNDIAEQAFESTLRFNMLEEYEIETGDSLLGPPDMDLESQEDTSEANEEYPQDDSDFSPRDYYATIKGEHREQVFRVENKQGESRIERLVGVARSPVRTPDFEYAAYWRLTDNTIYCYDVEAAAESGRFDPSRLRDSDDVGRAVNIFLEGAEYNGQPAFEIRDSYHAEYDLLGYISPEGELLESQV